MTDRERFKGRCPYTDKPCRKWNCSECEVNAEEAKLYEDEEEEI